MDHMSTRWFSIFLLKTCAIKATALLINNEQPERRNNMRTKSQKQQSTQKAPTGRLLLVPCLPIRWLERAPWSSLGAGFSCNVCKRVEVGLRHVRGEIRLLLYPDLEPATIDVDAAATGAEATAGQARLKIGMPSLPDPCVNEIR